ncbi:MAG: alpha-mannosidase [Christensenellales bacterium]
MPKTLHMIGNAHIDPVWLWRWQDGFQEVRATFRSALDRLREDPDFVFTSAASLFYEWVEETEPAMFEEIRARVREGRWQLVGGMLIQPDCNLPSGESFARHALYAQGYFLEKFGRIARTGYNVDSFGHSGLLPKILRKSGMDRYVFMRPGVHEKALPARLFRWESPEGVGVSAYRLAFEYCSWGKELSGHIDRCAQEVSEGGSGMCFYGVGNHGGGPTKENLRSIHALDGRGETALRFSSPDAFFDGVPAEGLPTFNGDLVHHASGCYSVHSQIKALNRQAESRLYIAEAFSALAHWTLGTPYPAWLFKEAWKKLLFNQFHDILAGSSIKEAYDDAAEDLGFALSSAASTLNLALQRLMSQMDLPLREGSLYYAVFNPQGFPVTAPVAIQTTAFPTRMALCDEGGNRQPHQLSRASAAARGRATLHFMAQVPPLGWRVYRLDRLDQPAILPPAPPAGDICLENDRLKVAFHKESGLPDSLILKASGTQLLRAPLSLQVIDDDNDTWAHQARRFDQVISGMTLCSIRIDQQGPVFQSVLAQYRFQDSVVMAEFALSEGEELLRLRLRISWQGRYQALKLHIPLALNYLHVSAQGPFGHMDRELDGEEYPMHMWVDMTGAKGGGEQGGLFGLSVLNDGKYAYDAHDRSLNLTLLRSPAYAHHEPFQVGAQDDYPIIDQGWQSFSLGLLAHAGPWQEAGTDLQARVFNQPLQILPEGAHPGKLPASGSLMGLEGGSAVIDAVKMAEDGSDALFLHLHETARRPCQSFLAWPDGERETLSFTPGEIKALRLRRDGRVLPCDLLEREEPAG